MYPNPLEGLVKHRKLDSVPRVSESVDIGGASEFIFLVSSMMMLMSPVQRLPFENTGLEQLHLSLNFCLHAYTDTEEGN